MLESLIRLSEAHARAYMKSTATVFDAISVIILMEHTLMSCLFGTEPTPSVIFRNYDDFCQIKDNILSRLDLDHRKFDDRGSINKEVCARPRTPSPIRKIEEENSMMCFGDANNTTFDQTDRILTFLDDSDNSNMHTFSKRSFK